MHAASTGRPAPGQHDPGEALGEPAVATATRLKGSGTQSGPVVWSGRGGATVLIREEPAFTAGGAGAFGGVRYETDATTPDHPGGADHPRHGPAGPRRSAPLPAPATWAGRPGETRCRSRRILSRHLSEPRSSPTSGVRRFPRRSWAGRHLVLRRSPPVTTALVTGLRCSGTPFHHHPTGFRSRREGNGGVAHPQLLGLPPLPRPVAAGAGDHVTWTPPRCWRWPGTLRGMGGGAAKAPDIAREAPPAEHRRVQPRWQGTDPSVLGAGPDGERPRSPRAGGALHRAPDGRAALPDCGTSGAWRTPSPRWRWRDSTPATSPLHRQPGQEDAAEAAMEVELRMVDTGGPGRADRARGHLVGTHEIGLQRNAARAMFALDAATGWASTTSSTTTSR